MSYISLHIHTHQFRTYVHKNKILSILLTPCNRVLLEKLIGSELVKKFPVFYGNRIFITAFRTSRQLSLSWARSSQAMPSHPTSLRSIFGRNKVSVQIEGTCLCFVTKFLRRRVVSTSSNTQDGSPTLDGSPRLLIQYIFAATHHIGCRSSIRNSRTRHAW